MSYQYNYKFWIATADQINDVFIRKKVFEKITSVSDKYQAHEIFSLIYTHYVGIVNRLSYLFDVTCQVQKRNLIKRLLEAATNRILELRNELKEIELSEFIYLDNVLIKLKVLVEDVQLLRPFYFPMPRDPHIQDLVDNKIPPEKMEDERSAISNEEMEKRFTRPKYSRLPLKRKSSIMALLAQTNPEQYNHIMATILIKVHEKARKARILLTNIRCDPEHYKPQAPDIGKGFYYEFTHKPDQPMLVLVKRTFYDSKYFIDRQISQEVDYYVRPVHRKLKLKDTQLKKSKGSDEGSLDDDFIKFENDFAEDTYFGEYERGDMTTSVSSGKELINSFYHGTPALSHLSTAELKERIKNTESFAQISQIAYILNQEKGSNQSEAEDAERESVSDRGSTVTTVPLDVQVNRSSEKTILPDTPVSIPKAVDGEIKKSLTVTSVVTDRRSRKSILKQGGAVSSEKIRPTIVENIAEDEDRLSMDAIEALLKEKLRDAAASVIQFAWRRYLLQKRIEKRRLQKLILYGMVSEWRWNVRADRELEEDRLKRRNKKALFDQQFIEAVENEKARILKVRGPWIMEDISDHIRAWFREFYDGTGEFDRYPEEFEGGTILVLRGETMTVPEYLQAKEDKKNKKKKSAAEKQKEKEKRKAEREKLKELKKKEKEKAKLQKKLEAKLGKTYNFSKVSPYYEEMKEIMKEYETEWANIDEKQNVNEDPYMEWISLDKFAEAHQELRLAVDELMRVEFELLRKALAEDRRKKYKPQKKKKQKKKKGKRGKKKKQPKDLTADRTIESLYHELKGYGLIKEMPRANLDEHVGEYNLSAYEKRMIYMQDPPPGHGEIKSVIREAIIGMGPLDVSKAKSILIPGAPNSGKQFLVQAIASEVGAIVFDISPENVVQFEANMKYFLHLINKMSRALQPTILYINQCERLFWKKVPKDQTDIKPRLLGKYIIKQIVKPIKKEDKVLVLGISNEPFKAKLGKMKKCFERIIIVPRADYGTTFQIHRVLAMKKYGLPRDIDFSAVSMVTKGYASSVVYNNLNATLGIERRMKFPVKPLKAQELIEGYFNREEPKFPITDDEFAKYIKFYTKANKLAKQRVKFMKEQEKLKAKEKPKGKK